MSHKSLIPIILGMIIVGVPLVAFEWGQSRVTSELDGTVTLTTPDGSSWVECNPFTRQQFNPDSLNMRLVGYYGIDPGTNDLAMQGEYLYMTAGHGFVVFDVGADPQEPPAVGTSTDLPWSVAGLACYGDYIYVSQSEVGVLTYDVSEPENPELIDRHILPSPNTNASSPLIVNNVLCVPAFPPGFGESSPQLVFLSLADRTHPTEIARIDLPDIESFPSQVKICSRDSSSFIIAGQNGYLCLIDLENPSEPQILAQCELATDRTLQDFVVDETDTILYACISGRASADTTEKAFLYSFAVGDFSAPKVLDSVEVTNSRTMLIFTGKDTLLVTCAAWQGENEFIDVSDPQALTVMDSFKSERWDRTLDDCIVKGGFLYGADVYSGLYVADISDITNPKDVFSFPCGALLFTSLTAPVDSKVFGCGWSTARGGGVFEFDASPSGELSTSLTPLLIPDTISPVEDIIRMGDVIGVILNDLIMFYDISQSGTPPLLGEVSVITAPGSWPKRLFGDGDLLYVCCGIQGITSAYPGGMAVVDISDFAYPWIINQLQLSGTCNAIAERDSVVYVAGRDESRTSIAGYLEVYRFTGNALEVLASITLPTMGLGLCLEGNTLYLSRLDTFDIYDVSDPASPVLLGSTSEMLDGFNDDVVASGTIAYVASDYELLAFDVSDPATPYLVGYYKLPADYAWYGYRQRLRRDDNHLYWATAPYGICVIEPYGPAGVIEEPSTQDAPGTLGLSIVPCSIGNYTIRYTLPQSAIVNLAVYDASGRRAETLKQGQESRGQHDITWNASAVPAGVYFVRLEVSGKSCTERAVVLR